MPELTHTPGPWTAFQRPAEVGSNYYRILLHGHPEQQELYGQDSLCGYCGEANARLVAAAPDLLKACKAMLAAQSARRHPLGSPDEGIAVACGQAAANARDAIAKATGK